MQVILMEKVANLGELGDVVKVKDGFARNFLIRTARPSARPRRPQGLSKDVAPSWRRRRPRRWAKRASAAPTRGLTLQIAQKRGPTGACSVSVTNYDIVEALQKQGHEVGARQRAHAAGAAQAGGRFPDPDRAAHRRHRHHHRVGAGRAVVAFTLPGAMKMGLGRASFLLARRAFLSRKLVLSSPYHPQNYRHAMAQEIHKPAARVAWGVHFFSSGPLGFRPKLPSSARSNRKAPLFL